MAILAVIGLIGSLGHLAFAIYYNLKYGWIPVDPNQPVISRLAITPVNVLIWQCGCWWTVASGVAAYACFRGRWKIACAGTLLFLVFFHTGEWLTSL